MSFPYPPETKNTPTKRSKERSFLLRKTLRLVFSFFFPGSFCLVPDLVLIKKGTRSFMPPFPLLKIRLRIFATSSQHQVAAGERKVPGVPTHPKYSPGGFTPINSGQATRVWRLQTYNGHPPPLFDSHKRRAGNFWWDWQTPPPFHSRGHWNHCLTKCDASKL